MLKKIGNIIVNTVITVGAIVVIGSVAYENYEVRQELNEYKRVYDGLELYEDGSWAYKDKEYFFWNWDLKYIEK